MIDLLLAPLKLISSSPRIKISGPGIVEVDPHKVISSELGQQQIKQVSQMMIKIKNNKGNTNEQTS